MKGFPRRSYIRESLIFLIKETFLAMSYRVSFDEQFSSSDYRLLEVPEYVLKEIEEEQSETEVYCFKGKLSDEAVFCTKNKTFSVKLVESTNTLFLLDEKPPIEENLFDSRRNSIEIIGSCSYHYELNEINPKLQDLRKLLSEKSYSGPLSEALPGKVYTFKQLRSSVQASEKELLYYLDEIGAFELSGFWRLLSTQCIEEVMNWLLNESIANSWDFNCLSQSNCINALASDCHNRFDSIALVQCLKMYGHPYQESYSNKEIKDVLWALDMKKISIFRAEQLLRNATIEKKIWNLEEFLSVWRNSLPDSCSSVLVDLDLLRGIAIVNSTPEMIVSSRASANDSLKSSSSSTICYLPVTSLSSDPTIRFRTLFEKRKIWTFEDIGAYIRDLVPLGTNPERFLLKYSRAFQSVHGRMFTSKE